MKTNTPPEQGSRNFQITVNDSSVQILAPITGELQRTQIILTNISTTGQKITIAKQDNAATAYEGIVLNQGEHYVEASDGGYLCYQGAVQAIASAAAGSLAITESFVGRSR